MDVYAIIESVAAHIYHAAEARRRPKLAGLCLPSSQVGLEMQGLGVSLMYPVPVDSLEDYYYTRAEDWAELLDYIYFKYPKPKYVLARMDCDDFAVWMKGLVAAEFGLNYFGLAFGNSPMGYHAFNLFRTPEGLMYLEPQTGSFFPPESEGYRAERVLI